MGNLIPILEVEKLESKSEANHSARSDSRRHTKAEVKLPNQVF